MPGRNKKAATTNNKKKIKDMPPPMVTSKSNRPFVAPTDPSWNPMEERLPKNGWCVF